MTINSNNAEIFADSEISIDAQTDKNSYNDGSKVIVSGTIDNFEPEFHSNTAITYRTLNPNGEIVSLGQTTPNSRGDFSFNFEAGGSFFTESGNYPVHLFFESVKKEIFFSYSKDDLESAPENNLNSIPNDKKIITLNVDEPTTVYLDSANQVIRASVEIQNYSPSDGEYFMKVTHIPTKKILHESVIYPKYSGNDLWAVQIAYPILETDIQSNSNTLTGEYEIHVSSEFNSQTAIDQFWILESFGEPIIQNTTESEIPGWIKSISSWWSSDKISESEFLRAIEYLIKNSIMKISNPQNENMPSITTVYSIPTNRSTEYAEITGVLPDKHEGPLTLTVIQPDQSEQVITTISRNGNFMTTMELNSDSLPGTYQVFAEIEGNQILVSAFSVKGVDSNQVPEWVKNNADWWARGLISDDEFVKGIQYLIEQRNILI
ncbi:MAG: hypothetical protein ACE5DL_02565 [Nitrosopumilaceae archaeon]